MSKLEADFQFEIGELLYLKAAGAHSSGPYQIQERLLQQCNGGIQLQYTLVGMTHWFPELAFTRENPRPRESDVTYRNIQKKLDEIENKREPRRDG